MARDHRRLAAIVLLDVVGYSRLMGLDESGTLAVLKAHRRELIDPKIAEHFGRIVKGTGDGLLLEFSSVVDAVRCAVDVQRGMAERNADIAPDQRLDFRIGINVGDIIIDGDDIFGDGINVAARLEALANPGGICVSGVVRDQVRDKLSVTFKALGAQQVKNIARPVEAYLVVLDPGAHVPSVTGRWKRVVPAEWRLPAIAVLGTTGLVAVVAAMLWLAQDRGATEVPAPKAAATTISSPKVQPPALDPKSVAVLPFENLTGRSEDAYLADGLQEEILNALARLRDLKVISRTSVMEYRGKANNVREIGQRLGAGTILEGSIRRVGNTMRLTVQLIDAGSDRHLFATNYDRDVAQILDLQSTVARQVSVALAATLSQHENGELTRVATNSGDAYDRYLRAVALYRRPVPGDGPGVVEAKRLLGEALRFDANYADALALLSMANTWSYFAHRRPEDGAAAKQALERALTIDPKLPEAHLARGLYSLYVTERMDLALSELAAVAQLRPNSAEANAALGYVMRRQGQMEDALGHLARAWELDPLNDAYSGGPIVTLIGLRRYPEAVEQTRLYARRFPDSPALFFARARLEGTIKHSIEPLRTALREHGTLLDPPARATIEYEIARAEGRYLEAARLLASTPGKDPLARGQALGFLYRAAGDTRRAEQSFRDAETHALAIVKKDPGRAANDEFMRALATVQSMLGKHAAALATIEEARRRFPEARDAINGPPVSFTRSIILVRAARSEEGYAEVARLLRVPFGGAVDILGDPEPVRLLLKDDPHYDEILNNPPRL